MIVISPNDIKIKHKGVVYSLNSCPYLGFSYSYLYYEPEVNHYKKIVLSQDPENQSVGYQDQLTNDEKTLAERFLTSLDDPTVLAEFLDQYLKQPDVVNLDLNDDPPAVPKHAVDVNGFYQGQVVLPRSGLTEVASCPPKDLYLESLGVAYKWNFDTNTWIVNGDYREQRKHQYLTQTTLGDQLDAIIGAIDSLSRGQPLPEKFNQLLATITAIKQEKPKT